MKFLLRQEYRALKSSPIDQLERLQMAFADERERLNKLVEMEIWAERREAKEARHAKETVLRILDVNPPPRVVTVHQMSLRELREFQHSRHQVERLVERLPLN